MNLKTSKYSELENKILSITRDDYKYFLNKANIVSIGLGYKIKNGFCTNEKCIKIYTTKKVPKYSLNNEDIVETIYKGIKTDIVSSGSIYMSSLTSKVRPVIGGYSIGNIINKYEVGSVGCLVTDGKRIYIK